METQQQTPTPVGQWVGRIQVEGTDLALPSTNVARVRQISPQAFISEGLIPDPLSLIIRQAINSKQGLPPTTLKKISEDPKMLADTMVLLDRVLAYVLIEPKCQMPPACEECGSYYQEGPHIDAKVEGYHAYQEGVRDESVLYTDMVDMQDKFFIFQWCLGGTRDLEKFREEQQSSVGNILDGKVVQGKAKRTARRK